MKRDSQVALLRNGELYPDGARAVGWFHSTPDGRLECDLCPRACRLKPGDRGFCFVRENRDGQMALTTYGRSTGFCIDPIEKKPLSHFMPGTSVLSFGTAGCNLGCKFCQNWGISKSREIAQLSESATPTQIATAARRLGCDSVAMTYNDPVIWSEYAIDTADACHELGVKTVAVTAGYINPAARKPFFSAMDAANVDLKGFDETFYRKTTGVSLRPVLDTLEYVANETDCWLEVTNLLIPQANDSDASLRAMCDWIVAHLGPDIPLHFSAFHPDFRMQDRPPTPQATLTRAHDIARSHGINHVYVGNVHDPLRQSTFCPGCDRVLVRRDGYTLLEYRLQHGRCPDCGQTIAGHFPDKPGNWGSRRKSVSIAHYSD